MAETTLESVAISDRGLKRADNQDAVFVSPEHGVFCVADGLGGAQDGSYASQTVVSSIRASIGNCSFRTLASMTKAVEQGIQEANRQILQHSEVHHTRGTGSTVVALVMDPVTHTKGTVVHAGDSRLYIFGKGRLQQLTRDHTYAEAAGVADKDLPVQFRGVVTRSVGIAPSLSLDQTLLDLERHDLVMLCSDGLSRMVPPESISGILATANNRSLDAVGQELVAEANVRGGADNISVVLVRRRPIDPSLEAITEDSTAEIEEDTRPTAESSVQQGVSRRVWAWGVLAGALLASLVVLGLWSKRSGASWCVRADTGQEEKEASRSIEAALVSGRWGAFNDRQKQDPAFSCAVGRSPVLSLLSADWSRAWSSVSNSPGSDAVKSRIAAMNQLLKDTGNPAAFHGTGDPASVDRRAMADRYCRDLHSSQALVVDALSVLRDQVRREVRYLESTMLIAALRQRRVQKDSLDAFDVTGRTTNMLAEVKIQVGTIDAWLGRASRSPWDMKLLRSCPSRLTEEAGRNLDRVWDVCWDLVRDVMAETRTSVRDERPELSWERITAAGNRLLEERNTNRWDTRTWREKGNRDDLKCFLDELAKFPDQDGGRRDTP